MSHKRCIFVLKSLLFSLMLPFSDQCVLFSPNSFMFFQRALSYSGIYHLFFCHLRYLFLRYRSFLQTFASLLRQNRCSFPQNSSRFPLMLLLLDLFCFSSANVTNSNHRTYRMPHASFFPDASVSDFDCRARMAHVTYSFLSLQSFCPFNLTLPCFILTKRLHFLRYHRWQKVTFHNGLNKVSIMGLAQQVLSPLLEWQASAVMFRLLHLWKRRHPSLSSLFVLLSHPYILFSVRIRVLRTQMVSFSNTHGHLFH